jgi:UDP-glucose 4-epimerase
MGRAEANGRRTGPAAARAVVTGAAGFIGSHLVRALSLAGTEVVGIDRARWPTVPELACPAAPGHEVTGDLATMAIEPHLEGAEVVFHLAGLPGVRPSWRRFDEYLRCNVLATQRVLEACRHAGVRRVVVASSSSVYGDAASGPMREDQLPAPVSPYAVTKLAAERLGLAYAARADVPLQVVVLRFFTVYGPRQRRDMAISRIVSSALDGAPVHIYGDGSHRRDFVYVGDVVRANLLAMTAPAAGEVVNVASGSVLSVNDVLDAVAELAGRRPDARYGAGRPGDVAVTRADLSKAAALLGYRPRTDLRTGLAAQLAAARQAREAVPGAVPAAEPGDGAGWAVEAVPGGLGG